MPHIGRPHADDDFDSAEARRLASEARNRAPGTPPQGATKPVGTPDAADRTQQGAVSRPGVLVQDTGSDDTRAAARAALSTRGAQDATTNAINQRRAVDLINSQSAAGIGRPVTRTVLGDGTIGIGNAEPGFIHPDPAEAQPAGPDQSTLFDRVGVLTGSAIGETVGKFNAAKTVDFLNTAGVSADTLAGLGLSVDPNSGEIVDSNDLGDDPNQVIEDQANETGDLILGTVDEIILAMQSGGSVDDLNTLLRATFQGTDAEGKALAFGSDGSLIVPTPTVIHDLYGELPIVLLPVRDSNTGLQSDIPQWGVILNIPETEEIWLDKNGNRTIKKSERETIENVIVPGKFVQEFWFPPEAITLGEQWELQQALATSLSEAVIGKASGDDAAQTQAKLDLLSANRDFVFRDQQRVFGEANQKSLQDDRQSSERTNLVLQLNAAATQGDASRTANLVNTLLGVEESRRSQTADFGQQTAIQSQGFENEKFLQGEAFAHDRNITGIRERAESERARLGRELEANKFEIESGLRLGDFETARARKENEIKLNNQMFALDILELLGARPELSGLILGGELGDFLAATGIDVAGILGDGGGSSKLDDLPTLADLQALPFDQQQATIRAISAARGVAQETIVAEIQRRAEGGGLASGQGIARRSLVA